MIWLPTLPQFAAEQRDWQVLCPTLFWIRRFEAADPRLKSPSEMAQSPIAISASHGPTSCKGAVMGRQKGRIAVATSMIIGFGSTASEARFLQVDPVGYKDHANLYVYVGNDPVNYGDPEGLYREPIKVKGERNVHRDKVREVKDALQRVLATPRGHEMQEDARTSSAKEVLWVNNRGENSGDLASMGTGRANIDPDVQSYIMTTEGPVVASLERKIGHELGHSVIGDDDDGPGRMNNITKNENPIADALGQPARTSHYGPSSSPPQPPPSPPPLEKVPF